MITNRINTTKKASIVKNPGITPKQWKDTATCYAMLLPQIIGFCLFSVYPIIWIISMSWFDYNGVTSTFIGTDNFIRIFTSDVGYWQSLLNTFIIALAVLCIEMPISLISATLLNSKLKGKTFFRTIFFMPNVVSVAIIGILFAFLFATFEGAVNNMLLNSNIINETINWFGHKWTSMSVIIIASIWQGFGINMLFFLSGLQNIPLELYESADIDGATKTQQFCHITFPMLAPVMQVVVMLAMIDSLKKSDLVLVLTNGQPAGSTEVVMTYIFKMFFNFSEGVKAVQMGYAASMGLVTAIVIGIITVVYLKATNKKSKIY